MKANQVDRKTLKRKGFSSPIALSEELVDSLPKEQQMLLFELASLAEKEKKIVDEINSKRPTADGILVLSGGAATVCEDEDDWRIITMNERQEWNRIKENIADNLNKALDLGLGFLGLIQRQCSNYGVKP